MEEQLTYHDLYITTAAIPRTSISRLPYGVKVTCSRVTGWSLLDESDGYNQARLLAGEYDDKWLRLDVDGHVILDTEHWVDEEGEPLALTTATAAGVPRGWSGIVDDGVPLMGVQP